ncbi:MAG: family 16 glycoside hydrolase, partial [Opitutales bacterium]
MLISTTGQTLVSAASEDYRVLFDGKTLEGWDGDPRFWRVEDGSIVGETTDTLRTPRNTFLIWEGEEIG